jgi:hypothetical protein
MGSGRQAGQFGQRGAQSRSFGQQRSFAAAGVAAVASLEALEAAAGVVRSYRW